MMWLVFNSAMTPYRCEYCGGDVVNGLCRAAGCRKKQTKSFI